MHFRVVSLPPFLALSSGVDPDMDFSPTGILGKFDSLFSTFNPHPKDSFIPRDFLYFDEKMGGLVWIYALTDETKTLEYAPFDTVDFQGGLYLTYVYPDGDDEANSQLYKEAMKYIEESHMFDLDIRPDHYAMGHVITPPNVIEAYQWSQMETYIPIKLK